MMGHPAGLSSMMSLFEARVVSSPRYLPPGKDEREYELLTLRGRTTRDLVDEEICLCSRIEIIKSAKGAQPDDWYFAASRLGDVRAEIQRRESFRRNRYKANATPR